MSHDHTAAAPATGTGELPAAPLTLEGAAVLHQMFRVRWPAWNALESGQRTRIAAQAADLLAGMEQSGPSALYSVLGHKGDLLWLHLRNSFDDLNRAELAIAGSALADYLDVTTSYLSIVELGLYDSSIQLYRSLAQRGVLPHSAEWNAEVEALLARQRQAMHPRLHPAIPERRYICFYPMDRKRAEEKNFYTLPITDRGRMMREHGLVGRRYSEQVQQIISGSMGFDDWEWGVDLFADDPVAFKKLIYEMRFDEVSAIYALFGAFYIGIRCPAKDLPDLMSGKLPEAAVSR